MSLSGKWAVALHGGAGVISKNTDPLPYEIELSKALDAGVKALAADPNPIWAQHGLPTPPRALAAALAAVEVMELSDLFNAGRGASLNEDGDAENEAAVMTGSDLKYGGVMGLTTVVHPSRLAAITRISPFSCRGFHGAEYLADKYKGLIERRDPSWFVVPRRKEALARVQARPKPEATIDHSAGTVERPAQEHGETVGATVCDGEGNVACVTSTGGLTNKARGRVGDTPCVGAGSYASNSSAALSGTGNGEIFLRECAASRVCFAMEYGGRSLKDAVHESLQRFPPNGGGFVGVAPDGEVVMEFNTTGMFRAARNWTGMETVRIWED